MKKWIASSLLLISAAAILLFGWVPTPAAQASPEGKLPPEQSLAIVVNRSNPVDNLLTKELRQIFMGERSHWPDGHRITLVMMEVGEPERRAVLQQIYRMNEADFSRHFLHGLFTGEVFVSPKTLATPTGVRKFVFNVPGSIGYLRASDVDDSVKVVRIDGRLPGDKGYKLQVYPPPAE
jgi:ABC-type phosphate transport system substrate-binding protein